MGYIINKYGPQGHINDDDPRTLNYKTGLTTRLNPGYQFNKGRLVETNWFAPDENGLYTVHVLTVENEYTDHPNTDTVDYRTTTRRWVVEGGGYGEFIKVTVKPYDERMAKREGSRRRQNIVNDLRDQTTLFGVQSQFLEMFRDLDLDIRAYQDEGDMSLISLVGIYKKGQPEGIWLEANVPGSPYTLRQAIMGALNYAS